MDLFVYHFIHSIAQNYNDGASTLRMADVLFAVNALSDGYFDNDKDKSMHVSYW